MELVHIPKAGERMLIYAAIQTETPQWSGPKLDETWFPAIAQGDAEAFRALYESASQSVFGFALSILRSRPDAEDAMQDTFLKVRGAAHLYQPMGKPLAWILRIARNVCLMQLRHRRHLADAPPEELCPDIGWEGIQSAEDRLALQSAFQCLTREEMQIVMLHAVAGLKHRETAALLGLPLNTVLSKYNRSLKRLRERMEEQLV